VRDEPDPARWQSGLYTIGDRAKPALAAFRFPLAEQSRVGRRTVLWGQVRPGGRNTYRLLRYANGAWQRVGPDRVTTTRGYFSVAVDAAAGARYRIWVPSARTYSAIVRVT
jgi:hypothetical protein